MRCWDYVATGRSTRPPVACAQGCAGGHRGRLAARAAPGGEGEAGTHVGTAAAARRHGRQPCARLPSAGMRPTRCLAALLRRPCHARQCVCQSMPSCDDRHMLQLIDPVRAMCDRFAGAFRREHTGVGGNAQPDVRVYRRTWPRRALLWLCLPLCRCKFLTTLVASA